uniref:Uncharacterized protein n=1 Tax=Marseillevirus LCMAC201 TaxID=2506605 RepID=A0A481YVS6_9VIRU|nr:MAG: hypothetical protein LCMAC201_01840 [Marseillevirus LCMAC201]
MCREPVDPDHRYVDEGIISEERRLVLKNLCRFTAQGLEWMFPSGLQGYTEKTLELLESNEGQNLLQTASSPENGSALILGISGLLQFISNGGLDRIFQYLQLDNEN